MRGLPRAAGGGGRRVQRGRRDQRDDGISENRRHAEHRQQSKAHGNDGAGSNRHARQYTIARMPEQSIRRRIANFYLPGLVAGAAETAARSMWRIVVPVSMMVALVLLAIPPALAAGAKYYFELHEVESHLPLNGDIRTFTGDAVREELASRPEWASDLGGAKDRATVLSELKKRNLAGFDVVVKITQLKKEIKEPSPGARLKRLSVNVKLSVLGTTLPGEKISFGGDGEAGAEAQVPDSRLDTEAESMTKDAIKDAVKQAVDQAVLKLGAPKSVPFNESKRKRKRN